MKLTIDGQEMEQQFAEDMDLLKVVQEVSAKLYAQHRIVLNYEIDGDPFKGDEAELADRYVSATTEMNLVTNSIRNLVLESLQGANGYLPQLIDGIEQTAVLLHENQVKDGMNLLQQCITGLGWFLEIIDKGTQLIATTLSPSAIADLPYIEKRTATNDTLNNLMAKLSEGDMVIVGDLLEFDLVATLKEWAIIVPQIMNRVEERLN